MGKMAMFSSLTEIVEQLRWCGYACDGGKIESNLAFRELEQMASEQNRRETMAIPIELFRGGERMTVYSEPKLNDALADGWQRVDSLSEPEQAALRAQPVSPWPGYDEMTVDDVLAEGLTDDQRMSVLAYEVTNKNRKGVVEALGGVWTAKDEQPPVTIETVQEAPLKTVETVEIVETDEPTKGKQA